MDLAVTNYLNSTIVIGFIIIITTSDGNAQETAPLEAPVTTCAHFPPIDIPDNKLLHFDNRSRVPNSYFVVFKCDKAFANYVARHEQVLPAILPTSSTNCAVLAAAYAARFGGTVGRCWFMQGFRSFSISGISDEAIADLALDSRIEYVEPDMVATTS